MATVQSQRTALRPEMSEQLDRQTGARIGTDWQTEFIRRHRLRQRRQQTNRPQQQRQVRRPQVPARPVAPATTSETSVAVRPRMPGKIVRRALQPRMERQR